MFDWPSKRKTWKVGLGLPLVPPAPVALMVLIVEEAPSVLDAPPLPVVSAPLEFVAVVPLLPPSPPEVVVPLLPPSPPEVVGPPLVAVLPVVGDVVVPELVTVGPIVLEVVVAVLVPFSTPLVLEPWVGGVPVDAEAPELCSSAAPPELQPTPTVSDNRAQ